MLVMQYQVGDVAFSPRVQDPETDQINDQFREIALDSLDDDVQSIKDKYRKDKDKE
jgi:hypothetical protein